MKRIAFYGGSFDPVHRGHLEIARALTEQFALDEFVFVPAFHAPHKTKKPTSAFDRYAMLCLATNAETQISVSKIEIELSEKSYTFDTLTRLKSEPEAVKIYFVMGADSWVDILTWRDWEKVLTMVSIIVVTRPDYEIGFAHVTDEIRARIVDLRGKNNPADLTGQKQAEKLKTAANDLIYITDAVQIDVSATEIREKISENAGGWEQDTAFEVAKYIKKYELYKKVAE